MAIYKIGSRVGAIACADKKEIQFLGFGVYEGDFVPTEAGGFFGELCQASERVNPRIRLDNGKVVYGCECYWSLEQNIRDMIESAKTVGTVIRIVDIEKMRQDLEDEGDLDPLEVT
jgi:hypothetical protein